MVAIATDLPKYEAPEFLSIAEEKIISAFGELKSQFRAAAEQAGCPWPFSFGVKCPAAFHSAWSEIKTAEKLTHNKEKTSDEKVVAAANYSAENLMAAFDRVSSLIAAVEHYYSNNWKPEAPRVSPNTGPMGAYSSASRGISTARENISKLVM